MGASRPMEAPGAEETWQLRQNFTVRKASDAHLFRCWKHQDCRVCLAEYQCSWCPMTSACVPNAFAIPLLAPAYEEDICPYWAERWEIRTRPLGCQVSTITSLTSIISIICTLMIILLGISLAFGARWCRRRRQQDPDWWRIWKYDWSRMSIWKRDQETQDGEQDPLLGHHDARGEGTQ
ncbi:hypothetical protein LX32DRAFT_692297 [Colletotrichum zoysiae]|uniref:PSI domain-containing protein n=1 Tax=Colletotrichum zoysiae TaxID=1216348 RepID=A0AAD9HMM7_9PEZI|nr:hypothetical protein LX32DRAFT_692297 [Colletotrichum zoysiae]